MNDGEMLGLALLAFGGVLVAIIVGLKVCGAYIDDMIDKADWL
jgi:hypothetical protein